MSYTGLGQIIPGATVGRDSSRSPVGGAVRVSARWAQRAANAGNRYNFSSAPLIAVDGRAGPITIAALTALSHQFSSDQPVTNDPPTSRITSTVIIPVALETALATKPFIADPPVSAATRRASTSGSSAASATEPVPGKPAPTPGEDIVIADEGSSGLLARYGIWPWAIGGAALVGVGLWFMFGAGAGAGVRANRRRVRRNTRKNAEDIHAKWDRVNHAVRLAEQSGNYAAVERAKAEVREVYNDMQDRRRSGTLYSNGWN